MKHEMVTSPTVLKWYFLLPYSTLPDLNDPSLNKDNTAKNPAYDVNGMCKFLISNSPGKL